MLSILLTCILASTISLGAPEVGIPAGWDEGAPHFNSAKVFGATVGKEFIYSFPTRGSRDGLVYAISGRELPAGVSFDTEKGILSGRVLQEGDYELIVRASNHYGSAEAGITLKIGSDIMLTPQLGWCSWNTYFSEIDSGKILSEAHAMVDKGLAARGFSSINIDNGWQGERTGKDEALQANEHFPDMKALTDEIHALGLRAGIYSTPMVIAFGTGPKRLFRGGTSGRIDKNQNAYYGIGMTHYEAQDAAQWAEWGFDYLKYDWDGGTDCDLLGIMTEAIKATDRDICISACTTCDLKRAEEYKGRCQIVRSNNDLHDSWGSLMSIFRSNGPWVKYVGPGFWYDLDMTAVGPLSHKDDDDVLEDGFRNNLSYDEQIFHYLYWILAANPIHLSFSIAQIDEKTLNLVCNEELLAINQDYPFKSIEYSDDYEGLRIGKRVLSDGKTVWGFFNYSDEDTEKLISLGKKCSLRDPLAMKDLGKADQVLLKLPPHCARIIIEK